MEAEVQPPPSVPRRRGRRCGRTATAACLLAAAAGAGPRHGCRAGRYARAFELLMRRDDWRLAAPGRRDGDSVSSVPVVGCTDVRVRHARMSDTQAPSCLLAQPTHARTRFGTDCPTACACAPRVACAACLAYDVSRSGAGKKDAAQAAEPLMLEMRWRSHPIHSLTASRLVEHPQ